MTQADAFARLSPAEQLLEQLSSLCEELPAQDRATAAQYLERLSGLFNPVDQTDPGETAPEAGVAAGFDDKLLLSRLIEQAPVGIAIVDIPDYRIVLANPVQMQLWHGKPETLGHTMAEIIPETIDQVKPILDRIVETGESFRAEGIPFDLMREAGQLETGYFNVLYSPLYDGQGRMEGLLTLTQEVTAQVRARQQLEAEQARLEAILQALPVGVWITDPSGRIILKNRQGDVIWAGDTPLSKDFQAYQEYPVFQPGSREPIPLEERPMVRALTRGETVVNAEFDIQRFDGTMGTILAGAAPVFDSQGELIGGVGVAQDISERRLARMALQESEARFHALANNIPQLAWIADAGGERTWYNQRWFDYTGTTLTELQGLGWQKVHHPAHLERVNTKYHLAIQKGEDWEDTFPLRGADGQFRWFLTRATPIKDEAGKVVRWFGTNTDITGQLEVEEALRRREEDLRLVMSATGVGFWEYDPQTGLGLSSPENARIYGLEELGPNFLTTWLSLVHPEDLGKVLGGIQKCLDEGSADLEYRYLPEGQERHRLIYTRARLTTDREGKRLMVGISLDATDQKLLQQQLQENEERLRLALEGARQGIWDWELHPEQLVWDARCRQIFGVPEGELVTYQWHLDHLHPDDRQRIREAAQIALSNHGVFVEDYRTFRPDGEMRWVSARGRGFYDISGQPYRMSGTVLDVTEQRRLEAREREQQMQVEVQRRLLEHRESERQDFARELHDGPIQNLIATLYNLNLGKSVFHEPQALLEFEQVERSLKSIIQELREITSHLRPPSLIHLGLDRAIKVHAVEFQEKYPQIQLQLDLPETLARMPELTGLALYRIFQEGLVNVVRHASATRVRVRLIQAENQVLLEIQDNGKGFAMPKDLRTQTQLGHFGMAGMSERAEAAGGRLLVASIPGKGTRIRARIPLEA